MALDQRKYEFGRKDALRDIRPLYVRLYDWLCRPANGSSMFFVGAAAIFLAPPIAAYADIVLLLYILLFWLLSLRDRKLLFKMPLGSPYKDGNERGGKAQGILFMGNDQLTGEELWFSNSDARTHILYLGTTGSGKTEGLKSMATNALCWGSGFIYIDGKSDTDLWSSLSSLVRRFGRDDDLFVLNYMTGNSDANAPSNTMNPFANGSGSYLTQLLVSLMPVAEGDNAMWKERAVSLVSSLMPCLTWKRDNMDIPMNIGLIRESLTLNSIIKLTRDETLPERLRNSLKGYLDTLPGYIGEAYDDDGKEKPPGPNTPMYDTTTPNQQHGYLAMQFTRALQSLGDDYGYIFDTQAADIDMVDIVLNRRILITLIPALEKSSDETANLGKIVTATLKGMMGQTLGADVEGEASTVIENKPTHSSTPFMTIFDEVGYYTAEGMAVMAAQARSLGFSLIFAAQDLPALQKRVKEEARSITANCNIKVYGKLEDPQDTREFFEKSIGNAIVFETTGLKMSGGSGFGSYADDHGASLQHRARADYDDVLDFKEGEAILTFGTKISKCNIFFSNPGFAKAMRVSRFVALPPPDDVLMKHAGTITKVRDRMVHKTWTAMKADVKEETPEEITALLEGYKIAKKAGKDATQTGMSGLVGIYALSNDLNAAPQEPQSPAPEIKPETTALPETSQPDETGTATLEKPDAKSESDSPLGTFAKKDTNETPDPTDKKEPVKWDKLVEGTQTEESKEIRETRRAAIPLDPEIEKILRGAGDNARKNIFKGNNKKDDPDNKE